LGRRAGYEWLVANAKGGTLRTRALQTRAATTALSWQASLRPISPEFNRNPCALPSMPAHVRWSPSRLCVESPWDDSTDQRQHEFAAAAISPQRLRSTGIPFGLKAFPPGALPWPLLCWSADFQGAGANTANVAVAMLLQEHGAEWRHDSTLCAYRRYHSHGHVLRTAL